ncbi:MAG: flagellar hook-basal body complex protein [Pseudomonadota bacterium]
MDNALHYLALNRQIGLKFEMDVIANNIANLDTTGFRREGVSFTEFVLAAANENSVSMADSGARHILDRPGAVSETNGTFDFAIEGPGFFLLEDEEGPILTRAGSFQISQDGLLTTAAGAPVLDVGGAQIPIPIEAKDIAVADDGTISAGDDVLAQLAIVDADQVNMTRFGNTAFQVRDDNFQPVVDPKVRQGALESSNVDAIHEIARMIEVTRAYELAQSVIEDEDERVRQSIQTLGENV